MELLDFYRALLPGQGNFCLWWKQTREHHWAESLEELERLTVRHHAEPDWYFATAAFGEWQRKQKFVTGKRCFYFDLDCGAAKLAKHGPEKVYATLRDGVVALDAFATSTGLMPSLLVFSGTGLHAYYPLDADCTHDEWTPVAHGLQELAVAHGLKTDAAVTADSARILRPLGSLHGNGKAVQLLKSYERVWSLDEIRAAVGTKPQDAGLFATERPREKRKVNDTLYVETPTSALKVASKCGALNIVAQAKGDVGYDEWWTMIGLVKQCVEGEELAQEWSSGHEEYSPAATHKKYESWEGGPPLCKTIERHSKACAQCPYRGKVSTPLELGRMNDAEVAALPEEHKPQEPESDPAFPTLSEGYKIKKDESGHQRLYYRKAVEKEGEDGKTTLYVYEVLSRDVFWLDRWAEAGAGENDGAQVVMCLWRSGRLFRFNMPTKVLGSKQTLLQFLAERAITPAKTGVAMLARMLEYVNDEFNRVKNMQSRPVIRSHFGLQYLGEEHNAEMVCAHGAYVIRKDQTVEEAMLGTRLHGSRNLFNIPLPPSPTGKWDKSVWLTHVMPAAQVQAKFIRDHYRNKDYEAAQLVIMLSLSSPLLVFTAMDSYKPGGKLPPYGLTVSLYSRDTARGKSSVQAVAAACYGSPSAMMPPGAESDTTKIAQSTRISMLGTMPFHADEVTTNSAETAGLFVNRIASGTDRIRADRTGALREAHTWALVGTVSTNIPQRELLASYQQTSDALQARLVEVHCEFPERSKAEHATYKERLKTEMIDNAGAIGALLNLAIVNRGPDEVQRMVNRYFEEAAKLVPGSSSRQRFLQSGMACVLSAHKILTKLGIELFDRQHLIELFEAAVKDSMDFSAEITRTPEDLLRKMVSDMSSNIIVTEHESHSANDRRVDTVINERTLRTPIVGRRVLNTGTLYLSSDAIKEWAREHQCSHGELLRVAKKRKMIKPLTSNGDVGKITLTKGTTISTVIGLCYKFDEAILMGETSVDMTNVVALPQKENRDDEVENSSDDATRDRTQAGSDKEPVRG